MALNNTQTAEQIQALRAKQKRDQAEYEANLAAGNTAATALGQTEPPMSTRDITITREGPSNPNDPNTPLGETFLPAAQMQEQYVDPVVAARFKRELPFFQATARAQAFKDPQNLPGVYAKGQVGLGGVPVDPQRQQQLEFLGTGRFDKTKGDNYIAVDPNDPTKVLRIMGTSADGRFNAAGQDMEKIKPPGSVLVKAGERSISPSAADNTPKNWVIPGPDGRPMPGSMTSSIGRPSPQHVLSTPVSSAPGEPKAWVLLDSNGRVVPGSQTTAVTPPNSNFVPAGPATLTPPESNNWVKIGPDGQPIPGSLISSPTQPEGYVKAATASSAVPNPLENEGSRLQYITRMTDRVVNNPDQPLTVSEAIQASAALEKQYGLTNKLQADARGNIVKFTGFQEHEVPGIQKKLAAAINAVLAPYTNTAAAGQPAAGPPSATNPPSMRTEVVSEGDANQRMATVAAAVGRAEVARNNIMTQIGFVGNQAPALPYVPNLAAAILAERNGGVLSGAAMAALDPKALKYLGDSKAWVEAVLRLASGAAIRPEEYVDYAQIFVPNRNDSREQIVAKVERMAQWAQITATASNANDATKMLMNVSRGDPVFHDMAIKMHNLARENGTLDVPFDQLPRPGQRAAPAGGPDPLTVNRILRGG